MLADLTDQYLGGLPYVGGLPIESQIAFVGLVPLVLLLGVTHAITLHLARRR